VGARLGGIGNETGTAGELRGDEGTPPAEPTELVPTCAATTEIGPPHLPQNNELGSFWAPHCRQNMIPPSTADWILNIRLTKNNRVQALSCPAFVQHVQI
jgi:hypothetical protein